MHLLPYIPIAYCINLLFYKEKTVAALEKIMESQMPTPEDL
jgi:hypothetical protein